MDYKPGLSSVIVVFCVLLTKFGTFATNGGGCVLKLEDGTTDVPSSDWEFSHTVRRAVTDTQLPGEVIYTFSAQNVISITQGASTQPNPLVEYISYKLSADKTQLIVEVAPSFADYEKTETIAGLTINTPVSFVCNGGPSDMIFFANVDLTNNNMPIFDPATEDVHILSMPYPNGLLVTTVVVTEIDLGNTAVALTLDPAGDELFTVMPARKVGKVHSFDLKAKKQLSLEGTVQVVAYAMDNSQGEQKWTTATLTFEADPALSTPPTPRFTKAVYTGLLDQETAVGSEITVQPPIEFSEGYHDTELTLALIEGVNVDPSYFEVTLEGTTVKLVLKSALPDTVFDNAYLMLVLEATRDKAANTGRTVIHLELPAKECATTPGTTEGPSTTACPTVTTPAECPTTSTTTECPACPTTEPTVGTTECLVTECPTTSTSTGTTECPVTTCPTECPTTTTGTGTTECPTCPTECPTTTTGTGTTECPVTTCPTECPSTTPGTGTTECPVTTCPTECPSTTIGTGTTECPVTTCPTECPTTTTGTGTTECPTCPTECTTTTSGTGTTECPVTTCPTECPTTSPGTGTTECPVTTCPTECPTTSPGTGTTECPVTTCPTECPTCPTDCPSTTTPGNWTTDCPDSTTITTTACPFDCSQCSTTTCPTTDCTTVSTTDGSTTTGSSSTVTECPTECPTECTTTGSSTSTAGSTTTSGPDEGTLTFEQSLYEESIEPNTYGTILVVTAIADPVRPLGYTLVSNSALITSKVTVDSGGNVAANNLPAGSFRFHIAAHVPGTSLEATTQVVINVSNAVVCGTEILFPYSVLVITVTENVGEVVIPGMTVAEGTDCVYELTEGGEYFSVNDVTGELSTLADTIDRESALFAAMETPQIRAQLHVTCADKDSTARSRHRRDATYDWSVVESVPNSGSDTVIMAVIDDLNDNNPIFEEPNPLVVGYPSESLLAQINPASLTKVKANDADVGKNALLRYSLVPTDDDRFYIHPTDGTIYVMYSSGTYTDQSLRVQAMDTDGEDGGRKSEITVQVKILSLYHVTEMILEGAVMEDVTEILESMSSETGLLVRSLSASVIPRDVTAVDETKQRFDLGEKAEDDSRDAVLRLVVYAVNGDTLVTSAEFLAELDDFSEWTIQEKHELREVKETDITGLKAAVITLGVLVILMLIGAGVALYIFYVRPKMRRNADLKERLNNGYDDSNSSMSSEESKDVEDGKAVVNVDSWLNLKSMTDGNDSSFYDVIDVDQTEAHDPSMIVIEAQETVLTQFVMPDDVIAQAHHGDFSGTADDTKFDVSSDEDEKGRDEDEYKPKKKLERKKSVVTFNESVDCIEIEDL